MCGKLVRNIRCCRSKGFFSWPKKTFFCSPHRRIQGVFFYYLLMASFLLQLKSSFFANIPWNVLLLQVPDCSHLFTTAARVFVCGFKYLSCQPVLTFWSSERFVHTMVYVFGNPVYGKRPSPSCSCSVQGYPHTFGCGYTGLQLSVKRARNACFLPGRVCML